MTNDAELVRLDSDYRRNLWKKMKGKVQELMEKFSFRDIWAGHSRNLTKIRRYLAVDQVRYYEKIRK